MTRDDIDQQPIRQGATTSMNAGRNGIFGRDTLRQLCSIVLWDSTLAKAPDGKRREEPRGDVRSHRGLRGELPPERWWHCNDCITAR